MADGAATPQIRKTGSLGLFPQGAETNAFGLVIEVILDAGELDAPHLFGSDPHPADPSLTHQRQHARHIDPQHPGDGFRGCEPVRG